jgi:hypothetical protein
VKRRTPVEWPSASVGSDALESLRDGNPPNVLITFAHHAIGAGNHAWAIEHLRRGVEYLRSVMTSFPEVTPTVQPHLDAVINVLVHAAAAIGDEATLEYSLPAIPSPAHIAGRAWKLLEAKHAEAARQWFARARTLPMDDAERAGHLLHFGVAELSAQKRAKVIDPALAAELVDIAKAARAKLDPRDEYARWRKREVEHVFRAAQKALASMSGSG